MPRDFAKALEVEARGQRTVELASYAVDRALARTAGEYKRAVLMLRTKLVEAFWLGSCERALDASRLISRDIPDVDVTVGTLLRYWRLLTCVARVEGELPAWEGLRVIQDKSALEVKTSPLSQRGLRSAAPRSAKLCMYVLRCIEADDFDQS